MFENAEKRFNKDIFMVLKICYTKEALKCSANLCFSPRRRADALGSNGQDAVERGIKFAGRRAKKKKERI